MNYLNCFPAVFKLKKLCLTGLLCLMGIYATPSQAFCTQLNGWTNRPGNIAFSPIITVPISTPDGTTLDTKTVAMTPASGAFLNCDTPVELSTFYYGSVSGSGPIGNTNVPGVGARITFSHGGINTVVPTSEGIKAPGTVNLTAPTWKIELIKTGPIAAGQMATGAYAGYGGVGLVFSTFLNITGGGQIVLPTCSVSNTAIPVPIGAVNQSQFGAVGTTAGARDFSVPLSCAVGTRIRITLAGTADSSGAPGVLALAPASGTVAQGVGVQLLYNNVPVTFNSAIDAGTAASAGAYNIPLVARYYRTGAIRSGVANSSATFTMSYN